MRSFVEKRRTAFFAEKSSIFLKKSLDISSASRYNNTRRQGHGLRRKEYADVAELADALDSGSSSLKRVWVQIPSSAPKVCDKKNVTGFFLCCIAQNQRSRRPIFKVRFIEMSNRFQAVGLFCWAAWCEFSLPCRPVLQFFSGIFNFFLLFSECFQFPRSQFLELHPIC